MNKPAFIAGQSATISREAYLILCKVCGLLPKDSASNQILCHIDRVGSTYIIGEPTYDIVICGEDPLDQQVLQGVCESQLTPIIASCPYPTSKFKVGDHVKISIDHYFKIYKPPMAPDLPKRVGTITSIFYNAITPTGKCTNKYKVKLAYYDQPEVHNLVEEEDLELWDIHYDTQKKRDPLWNPPDIVQDLWEEQSITRNVIEKIIKETNAKMTFRKLKGDSKQTMPTFNLNQDMPKFASIVAEIDRVIFNDPATIILWKSWHHEIRKDANGIDIKVPVKDKTIVKCAPGEEFNKYNGFCAAVTKYVFGTNSEICRIIKNAQDDSVKKEIKKKNEETKTPVLEKRDECKYYNNKFGRKVTCKQINNCDGKFNPDCAIRAMIETSDTDKKKKKKGSGKK